MKSPRWVYSGMFFKDLNGNEECSTRFVPTFILFFTGAENKVRWHTPCSWSTQVCFCRQICSQARGSKCMNVCVRVHVSSHKFCLCRKAGEDPEDAEGRTSQDLCVETEDRHMLNMQTLPSRLPQEVSVRWWARMKLWVKGHERARLSSSLIVLFDRRLQFLSVASTWQICA